jgi:hypothetical protein
VTDARAAAGAAPGEDTVELLRDPRTIRGRAARMLALARQGALAHLALDEGRLPAVVDRVLAVTRASYPDLAAIPYHSRWRHFGVGGVDRAALLDAHLAGADPTERLRARIDLVVTSVLLDAGAGPAWGFVEPGTGARFSRSEGLAVASVHMFLAGGFSSAPGAPRADAAGLAAVDAAALGRAFQAGPDNPLVGLEGRAALLGRLGAVVAADPVHFPAPAGAAPRVGHLGDHLLARARGGVLSAAEVLAAVLAGLGPIWPGRHSLGGVNLGDVWPHPQVGLVPFHKLSQWLTYSLFEPLEAAGVRIAGVDALTGLAEYRNGGLFLDEGVLCPRHEAVLRDRHPPDAPVIVEWRALTVALLDEVAARVRERLGLDAAALPLAKVLEGGTWAAGRQVARERRPDGGPPLQIESDGTVF